jgi:hypothetical protein
VYTSDTDFTAEELKELVEEFKAVVKQSAQVTISLLTHGNNFGVLFVLYSTAG